MDSEQRAQELMMEGWMTAWVLGAVHPGRWEGWWLENQNMGAKDHCSSLAWQDKSTQVRDDLHGMCYHSKKCR